MLNDDEIQAKKARAALAQARSEEGVFIPLLVLAELSWVLRRRWEKERVLNALEALLHARGVRVESSGLVRNAFEAPRESTVGVADHLIAAVSMEARAKEILTFDRAFGRFSRVRDLI